MEEKRLPNGDQPSDDWVPGIGKYRVIREIGRGRESVVFLAERDDGEFEQQVVLKLIRRDVTSDEALNRLSRERQILVALEHPAIAGLVDAGETGDGRPYLATEYVDGLPIDVYCERHRLGAAERLRLLDSAAAAVEYAHRNLIAHQDLKPDNILVAEGGHVKLLGFGFSPVLGILGGTADSRGSTNGAVCEMTYDIVSPEQLQGGPATTAVDVFQLGVVMDIVVTGTYPVEAVSGSRGPDDSVTPGQENVPPSATDGPVWRRTRDDALSGAAKPGAPRIERAHVHRSRNHLRGDVDAIIKKAIRTDPNERYASVRQLRDDIARHLEGRPVAARCRTVPYVLGGFLRRHASVMAFTATILAMIGGLGGVFAAQLAREHERTQSEAQKANQIAVFLQHLFDVSESDHSDPGQTTARELLDRGVERIAGDLDRQPGEKAEIMAVMGKISYKLGLYGRAERLLLEALEIREGVGDDQVGVASILRDLGIVYYDQGKHAAAEAAYQRALSIREGVLGPSHPDVAACVNSLAILRYDQGNYDAAESLYLRALGIWEAAYGPQHQDVAAALQNLAILHRRRGAYESAEGLYRRARDVYETTLGRDHPSVASCVNGLAVLCFEQGRYDEAERFYRSALEIRETAYGPDHPDVAISLNNLALLNAQRGRFAEARPFFVRAMTIWEETLGPDHPNIASALNNLADIETSTGNLSGAAPLIRRALEIREKAFGADHPAVAESRYYLADFLAATGDEISAELLYRDVTEIWQTTLGPDHPAMVALLNDHARLLTRCHRIREARALFDRCLGVRDAWVLRGELSSAERMIVAAVHLAIGEMEQQNGDMGRARAAWIESDELARSVEANARDVDGLAVQAQALLHLGLVHEAEPLVAELRSMGWSNAEFDRLCATKGLSDRRQDAVLVAGHG